MTKNRIIIPDSAYEAAVNSFPEKVLECFKGVLATKAFAKGLAKAVRVVAPLILQSYEEAKWQPIAELQVWRWVWYFDVDERFATELIKSPEGEFKQRDGTLFTTKPNAMFMYIDPPLFPPKMEVK